mgnify:CR=1 FL=1
MSAKPKIAAFPKGWIRDLVAPDKLSIYEWIDMSQAMGIEGLEMYNNFADFKDEANWPKIRKYVEATGMVIPMMCCSPDFTIPDPVLRQKEVDHEIHSIRMSAELGAKYCRVLSGQRRKDITQEQGMGYVVDSIEKCLENVLKNVCSGSIIVFHDSQKAFKNLEYTLPKALQFWSENGFVFDTIPLDECAVS